jgi:hypothetical protein
LRYFGTFPGGTWSTSATAIAPGKSDSDAKSGTKPTSGSVGTRVVTAAGGGATASAVGNLNFKKSKSTFWTLLVSPRGSFADVKDPGNVGASASYIDDDPAFFDGDPLNPTVFDGAFTLESGFDISAVGIGASADYSFSMGSSHSGYEDLLDLTISMDGSSLGSLKTAFHSNPKLGLSDDAIASLIQSSLLAGGGTLSGDLPTVSFEIPDIRAGETLALTTEWRGSVATAPEPDSIALVLVGMMLVAASRVLRRLRTPSRCAIQEVPESTVR